MNRKQLAIKIISLTINLFLFTSSMVTFFRIIFAPEGDIALFRYFTNLCNIYMGIVSLIIFVYLCLHFKKEFYIPKWMRIMELSGVTSVMLTLLTVICFIAPITINSGGNFFDLYKNDMFFFHLLNPLLSFIVFLFLVKGDKLNYKEDILGHRMGILGCSTAEMKMSLGC